MNAPLLVAPTRGRAGHLNVPGANASRSRANTSRPTAVRPVNDGPVVAAAGRGSRRGRGRCVRVVDRPRCHGPRGRRHRASGVQHAVQAHRTQQCASHRVMPMLPTISRSGGVGGVAQHRSGLAGHGVNGDRHTASDVGSCRGELVDVLLERRPDVLDQDRGVAGPCSRSP
jgi:hypothetical protein